MKQFLKASQLPNRDTEQGKSGGETPQSKEAGCGLTFPASDLPLPYPCLSSPLPLLPLLAESVRRIYSLVLRRPLHHGPILLLSSSF